MASVEQFVESKLFAKTYQDSYQFFKRPSAKKDSEPKLSNSQDELEAEKLNYKNRNK